MWDMGLFWVSKNGLVRKPVCDTCGLFPKVATSRFTNIVLIFG